MSIFSHLQLHKEATTESKEIFGDKIIGRDPKLVFSRPTAHGMFTSLGFSLIK
jgi:hypothetical protein